MLSVVRFAYSRTGRTVCLRLCVNAFLAYDLQLLRGNTVDQPILFVDRLRSDGLEEGGGHREGRGRKARVDATRSALSMMELVGPGRGLPAGSFLCWLGPEHADRVS